MASTWELTRCRLCNGDSFEEVLDLGYQPLAERADSAETYPLRVMQCRECDLAQLSVIVAQEEVFPAEHPYATGNSIALKRHFADMADHLGQDLATPGQDGDQGDLAVDIGCNDGTLLKQLARKGIRCVGVEPTNQVAKLKNSVYSGLITGYQEFFGFDTARRITRQHGRAKLVTANNVLAHVAFPHEFITGVKDLLTDDGVFVTENHDWLSVAAGLQVDTVYHEHLRYFTIGTLSRLLGAHGLVVRDVERIGTHGGSFRTYAVKDPGATLNDRSTDVLSKLHYLVKHAAQRGPVWGVGAATRATPLIHGAGLSAYIDMVCEVTTSDKLGTRMPGTQIPVISEVRMHYAEQPAYAVLFAWHMADDIIPKLRKDGYKGKFIVPLPEPRIIDE